MAATVGRKPRNVDSREDRSPTATTPVSDEIRRIVRDVCVLLDIKHKDFYELAFLMRRERTIGRAAYHRKLRHMLHDTGRPLTRQNASLLLHLVLHILAEMLRDNRDLEWERINARLKAAHKSFRQPFVVDRSFLLYEDEFSSAEQAESHYEQCCAELKRVGLSDRAVKRAMSVITRGWSVNDPAEPEAEEAEQQERWDQEARLTAAWLDH